MDKLKVLDFMKGKDKKGLHSYLLSLVPESEKLPVYSSTLISYADKPHVLLFDGTALKYEDGFEYSPLYTLVGVFRISNSFSVDSTGVFSGKHKISSIPIVPIKKLIIDNGKYPSYYRFANLYKPDESFIGIPMDVCYCKKFIRATEKYIQECLYLNSDRIEEVHF